MGIRYYVKAAISEYTDKDGKAKKKYQSIGVVIETKNGLMLKLESLPLLSLKDGSLMCYLNEPEDKPSGEFPATLADIKEDLPF